MNALLCTIFPRQRCTGSTLDKEHFQKVQHQSQVLECRKWRSGCKDKGWSCGKAPWSCSHVIIAPSLSLHRLVLDSCLYFVALFVPDGTAERDPVRWEVWAEHSGRGEVVLNEKMEKKSRGQLSLGNRRVQ